MDAGCCSPFPPAAVVGAAAAAKAEPLFQGKVQLASLLGFNSIPCLLGQLVHYLLCHFDEAVIRRRVGGAPLGVRLLLDCSVVLFSFPEGNDGITLDSRRSNMSGG